MKNTNRVNKSEVESVTGEDMNNSSIYLPECDSKGIPLLKRVEKYPDLPEDEFIPIEYTHSGKEVPKHYLINKKGEVINSKTGSRLKANSNIKGYLSVIISFNNKQKSIPVHRLVAATFLKNIDINVYSIVNHIDHIKNNNKLSNLEWVTYANNANKTNGNSLRIDESKLVQYIALDPKTKKEVFRINQYNCPDTINIISMRSTIGKFTKNGEKTYQGYIWTREGNDYENKRDQFYSKIKFSGNFNDYKWYKHWKYENYFVCEEGFLRKGDKILGTLDEKGYVYVSLYGETTKEKLSNIRVHRIIAEFILMRDLRDDEIVDHINTIPYDNSFSNLRVCSQKENMNNPVTKHKLTNKLILTDKLGNFISYGTANELSKIVYKNSKFNKLNHNEFLKTFFPGDTYLCISPGDKNGLIERMKRVIYVISEDKNSIWCFKSKNEMKNNFTINEINLASKTINKYFNSGKAYRGYFIMQGSEAVNLVLSLGNGTALDFTIPEEVDISKIESLALIFNPENYVQIESDEITDSNKKGVLRYDLLGRLQKTYNSRSDVNRELKRNISIEVCTRGDRLTSFNSLWCNVGDEDKIKNDLKYIFYKFNKNKEIVDIGLSLNYFSNNDSSIFKKLKKYLNTGMPAPDGYYYQQGDPENMLYDPNNTDLIPKREILKWKPKNKK